MIAADPHWNNPTMGRSDQQDYGLMLNIYPCCFFIIENFTTLLLYSPSKTFQYYHTHTHTHTHTQQYSQNNQ